MQNNKKLEPPGYLGMFILFRECFPLVMKISEIWCCIHSYIELAKISMFLFK